MLQEHAKIVQFISIANEVKGRKKMQKMIYIAKKMNFPFAEKYELHMYGPYSEELTLRIEELCAMGFLAEACVDKGSYVQYSYTATNEGTSFLETAQNPHESLAVCVDKMNVKSSRFLELVSTLLYLQDRSDPSIWRPELDNNEKRRASSSFDRHKQFSNVAFFAT